uniref:Uncharacterized protein n=1 Tax=Panagrolaimus sp. ES5 TaxID=591445 RepID=A0AC34F2C3_9BILA
MTNSTGRFRVGKVVGDPGATSLEIPTTTTEKRIKRGRWECKEWYDHETTNNDTKRQAKAPLAQWNDISFPVPILNHNNHHINNNNSGNMLTPTNLLSQQNDLHSSSTASSLHSHPPLAHETAIFSMEEQSDDSDRENNLPEFNSRFIVTPGMDIHTTNSSSTTPSTSIEKPNSLPLPPVVNIPTSRSKLFGTSPDILSGRATPLEMQLHYGLERSLSGGGGNIFYPLFDPQTSSTPTNGNMLGSSVSSQD